MPTGRNKYRKVIASVYSTPWAILPSKMADIVSVLELRKEGVRLSRDQIGERLGPMRSPVSAPSDGKVALLNLFGTISQRMNFLSEFSGGTSTEQFGRRFDAAIAEPDVSAIVINIDSPGGAVPGVQELSDKIYAARGSKPIIAVVNPMMASAAYWIGSAADEIVAVPSATDIGSIGVLTIHQDASAAYEKAGIKNTIIRSTDFKAEANPYETLSEAALEHIQERVTKLHADFIDSVARNRGVSASRVEADYGKGRTFLAKDALNSGLVDRIATLDEVLSELGVGSGSSSVVGASHQAKETKMNPKLMTLLVRLGACDADEEQANAFIDKFYTRYKGDASQRADSDEKVLHDIELASKAFSAGEFVKFVENGKASVAFPSQPATPPETPKAEGVDVSDILAAVNLSPLAPEAKLQLQGELVKEAKNLSYSQVLDRINSASQDAAQAASPTVIRVTESERDKFHDSARDAILLRRNKIGSPDQIFNFRTGAYQDWKPERGNHGLSNLQSLAQQCLVMCGVPWQQVHNLSAVDVGRLVMGANPQQIGLGSLGGFFAGDGGSYNVSGMFSNILLDAANVSLRRSFDDSRTSFRRWMRQGEAIRDFKPVHRVIAGEFGDPKAIPEDGTFDETTLSDGKESYKLTVWGEIFSHSWQLVVNDRLDSFMEAPEKMGRAMDRKINRLAYQELKDNPTLSDTGALFNATAISTTGGHNNLTTGTLSTSAAYITAWNTMTQKMAEQKGLDSDSAILNLMPRFIVYPPGLRGIVMQTLGSTSVAINTAGNEGTVNIWQNGLEGVEEGELGSTTTNGSDTAFYLAADSMDVDTIEYAYLQGMDSPVIEQEVAFDRLAMRRRIYFAFGTKALDFRGLQKHTGA